MVSRSTLRTIVSTAAACCAALWCASFVVAPVAARAATVVAQASTSAVTGTVTDDSGAPVVGAVVTLRGAKTYRTRTDAKGAFSIADAGIGVYDVTVSKPGYATADQVGVTLIAGQPEVLTVRIERATFSSLRTIATVRANAGRGSINTAAASEAVVDAQTFTDQGQSQVTRVLSQVPGVQVSFPSESSNAAAPGAITIPNIRSATSYETASLIDGHPISVGQYGDNVTTFLNANMFGSVEVVKGPGADAPVVNNAIGGTTNFRTKDPTRTPEASISFGFDNHGGSLSNFSYSNTVGKLGFVVDFATLNDASALNGRQVYFDPSGGNYNGVTLQGSTTDNPNYGGTSSDVTTGYSLLACCYRLYGNLDQTSELLKIRYQLSPTTSATVSYLGGQSYSDQNGNTSDITLAQFQPGDPSYSGSLPTGPIQVANVFAGAYSGEINNEPIFQAEVNTALGKDAFLARYYHAAITRFQYQGSNPNGLDYNSLSLYGTSAGLPTFNGTPAGVGFNDYYNEPETDKLSGGSFEWQHPLGDQDLLTFSVDRTYAQSIDYSVYSGLYYSFNLPPGTSQTQTTYLLRGHFFLGEKVEATLSNYLNTYSSTYPVGCPPTPNGCNDFGPSVKGTGVVFQTSTNAHYDPRLGFVYRPNASTSVRFALGSSIAPAFMGLLNQIASTPSYDSTNHVAIEQQSNGNLKPETAFGYDLGADKRLKDQTVISGDVYLTDLYNRFFGQTVSTGQTCSATTFCDGGAPVGTPIVNQTNTNISNARFQGIELSIKREPLVGLGYTLSGALERGYYYDLPPYFYCSIPGPGCAMDQNLNVIAGQNTNGVGIGIGGQSYNGNMRIPYSQGNIEVSYRLANGAYASFGDTYYGNNNSLNEPAFGIAYGTLRYPISKTLSLQLSGDNIFNAYPGILPIYGGGRPITLANGLTAATVGNVLGPATYRLMLSAKLP